MSFLGMTQILVYTSVDQQQQSHTNHPPVESPAHSYQPATSAEYPTQQTSDLKDPLQSDSFNYCMASDSISTISSSSSKATSLYRPRKLYLHDVKVYTPQQRHFTSKMIYTHTGCFLLELWLIYIIHNTYNYSALCNVKLL